VRTEEIPPDDSQRLQTAARPLSFRPKRLVKVSPLSAISLDSVLKTAITKTSATNTDLFKDHVYSDMEMDHNINKAIQMYEEEFFWTRTLAENTRDIGVQIGKTPEIAPVLFITERRDIAVQSEDEHFRREAFSQTEDLPRRLIEVGVSAKPRHIETAVQARPRTRDFGASDSTINDVICVKCKVKKRSIGVGDRSFTNLLAEEETFSLSNIGIVQNKPPDHTSLGTKKEATTRSIACGTRKNTAVSRGTDTDDLSVGKRRDFGVNTSKRKLVDAAVGDDTGRRNSGCGVFLCDKCDVVIKNVAKNILTQNSDSTNPSASVTVSVSSPTTNISKTSPSATISRIPRPAPARGDIYTSATTTVRSPIMSKEKHRIQRQNTYTKLEVGAESRHTTTTPVQEKSRYAIHLPSVRCLLLCHLYNCRIYEHHFNPMAYADI
jgi:hypothetical protein